MWIFTKRALALCIPFLCAGCGNTLSERALLGAGAGAAVSAVTKGDMATGALLGAVGNVAYCQKFPSRC